MPKKIKALEELARNMVGDGESPNLFFVSDCGAIITITRDFQVAYSEWKKLAFRSPRLPCMLEDRKTGVICDVDKDEYSKDGRLILRDDSYHFGFNK